MTAGWAAENLVLSRYENKKETHKVSSLLLNQDSRLLHPRKRLKTPF